MSESLSDRVRRELLAQRKPKLTLSSKQIFSAQCEMIEYLGADYVLKNSDLDPSVVKCDRVATEQEYWKLRGLYHNWVDRMPH